MDIPDYGYGPSLNEHLHKLHLIVEKECLASVMNNTKWMEVMAIVVEFWPQCRAKLLTEVEPTRWGSLEVMGRPFVEGAVGSPVHVYQIEWLEIESFQRKWRGALVPDEQIDLSEVLERRLREASIPFTREGAVLRITGHIRKAN